MEPYRRVGGRLFAMAAVLGTATLLGRSRMGSSVGANSAVLGIAIDEPMRSPEPLFEIKDIPPLGNVMHPGGLDDAPDGSIYVADAVEHRVTRFDREGKVIAVWGEHGTTHGSLIEPADVAVAPDGTVYVTDSGNFRVQRFTSDGRHLRTWGRFGSGGGEFLSRACRLGPCGPDSITIASDGRVLVDDAGARKVQVFSADGAFLWDWFYPVSRAREDSERLISMRAEPAGTIIAIVVATRPVVGSNISLMRRYGVSGTILAEWPIDPFFAQYPAGLTVSDDGMIYVSFREPSTVIMQVFSPDGTVTREWNNIAAADGNMIGIPAGLAVIADGTVFIGDVEYSNPGIKRFDLEGRLQLQWGRDPDASPPGWFLPVAVEAAPSGEFYAAYEMWRIDRYSARGELVDRWRPGDYEGVDLSEIIDLAMGPDGSLYVLATEEPHVLVFTPDGRLVRTWGETGNAHGMISGARAFTATPDGHVLISDLHGTQRFSLIGTYEGLWDLGSGIALDVAPAEDGASYEVLALGGCLLRFSPDARELGRFNVFPEYELRACIDDFEEDVRSPDDSQAEGSRDLLEVLDRTVSETVSSLPFLPRSVASGSDGSYFVSSTYDLRHVSHSGVILSVLSKTGFDPKYLSDVRDISVMPADIDSNGPIPPGAVILADTENARLNVYGDRRPLWRVELFDNPWLKGTPAHITTTAEVDLDWSATGPVLVAPAERFSARLEQRMFLSDTVTASLVTRGGARLWVGEKLLVNDWYAADISVDESIVVPYGDHLVRLELNATAGESSASLELTKGDVPTPTPNPTITPWPTPLPIFAVHLPLVVRR